MKKSVCLIVGFGPGVGFGLAKVFGREGFQLALLSRNPSRHADLLAEIFDAGFTAKSFAADAGDEKSLCAAIAQAAQELGETGVLIYNAIAPTFVKPTQLTTEQLVADFRVNVAGALAATRAVLPGMKARGRGTILFTGGGWALQPWDGAASPSIGKAGIRSLAYTLAQELGGSGIHVGTVTIAGQVAAGTHFDPDKIAEAYLKLHRQPPGKFETEIIYK
jgi:NAD(P)-dependent dehydrogenase (short-subunit alcohol dehydrogenase family)